MAEKIQYTYVQRDDGICYMQVRDEKQRLLHSDQPTGIGMKGERLHICIDAERGYISQDALAATLKDRLSVERAFELEPHPGFPFVTVAFDKDKLTARIDKVDGVDRPTLEGHISSMASRIESLGADYLA